MNIAIKPCAVCGALPSVGENRHGDESGEQYGYSFIECTNRHPDHRDDVEHFNGVHGDSIEACARVWNNRISNKEIETATILWVSTEQEKGNDV